MRLNYIYSSEMKMQHRFPSLMYALRTYIRGARSRLAAPSFPMNIIPFLFILLVSCQEQKQTSVSYPFKADVLCMNPLKSTQLPSESPTYTFAQKEFNFLTNINLLDGPYFKLYRGGSIIQKSDKVEFKGNKNPELNYKMVNNVVVAKEYSSIAMLSAYYQFDWIASKMQEMLGFSMDEIINSYGKIEIFFEPKISETNGGLINETFQKENAAYFPYYHKFILYSRSNGERVPLSMNLQVIAHEFGHSIWQFSFDNGRSLLCNRLNAEYSISGLNEGFADFLSYTLTGSTNVLNNSLNRKAAVSMRNFSIINFDYEKIVDIANQNNSICNQAHYCTGTLFANALFNAQKILGYDQKLFSGKKSRSEFLKIIVNALSKTRENIRYLPKKPEYFDTCSLTNDTSSYYNGLVLGIFFNAFLNQITDELLKNTLNCTLAQNFGTKGFHPDFRIGICL